jgi:hypothetical protein
MGAERPPLHVARPRRGRKADDEPDDDVVDDVVDDGASVSSGRELGPPPPAHLAERGAALWRGVIGAYEPFRPEQLELLRQACEAVDVVEEARVTLAREGRIYHDRFGAPRRHPATTTEENASARARLLLQSLALSDDEPMPAPPRPPRY